MKAKGSELEQLLKRLISSFSSSESLSKSFAHNFMAVHTSVTVFMCPFFPKVKRLNVIILKGSFG